MFLDNGAFISYRRQVSWATARLIYGNLKDNNINVFLDLKNLGSGRFDVALLKEIESRPYFLFLLEPGTLDRCNEPDDWLVRELNHAYEHHRIIIPIFTLNFSWGDAKVFLPDYLASELVLFNGILILQEYFEVAMERLSRDFLKPIELTGAKPNESVKPDSTVELRRDFLEPVESKEAKPLISG